MNDCSLSLADWRVSVDVRGGNKDPHGYQIVLRKDSGAWKITGVWFSWAA